MTHSFKMSHDMTLGDVPPSCILYFANHAKFDIPTPSLTHYFKLKPFFLDLKVYPKHANLTEKFEFILDKVVSDRKKPGKYLFARFYHQGHNYRWFISESTLNFVKINNSSNLRKKYTIDFEVPIFR